MRTENCPLLQDIDSAVATYLHLSERWFTHASPTLFNAGTPRPQLSSCFLIAMKASDAICFKIHRLMSLTSRAYIYPSEAVGDNMGGHEGILENKKRCTFCKQFAVLSLQPSRTLLRRRLFGAE